MTGAADRTRQRLTPRPRITVVGRFGGAFAAVVAAGLWIALAVRTPTNTFHFAPIIVAVVGPVSRRMTDGGPLLRRKGLVVAGAGGALAILTGVGLAVTGNLEGPTLWSDDGALAEVVLFALAATLYGFRVVTRERSGVLV